LAIAAVLVSCGQGAQTVSGNVIGKTTKTPATEIYICLCPVDSQEDPEPTCRIDSKLVALTDGKGHFFFPKVPTGEYILVFSLPRQDQTTFDRLKALQQLYELRVHYTWPVYLIDKGTGNTGEVDIFGGTSGVSSIPKQFPADIRDGLYKGKKGHCIYPKEGMIVSKQYYLAVEYVAGAVLSVIVGSSKGNKPLRLLLDEG
jgi:hypothetical protein